MIVNPDRGIFFVATALMCSVSLYGAQLSTIEPDPMTRIFVGEPNHLTLPPGIPATEVAAGPPSCLSTAVLAPAPLGKLADNAREDSCDSTGSEAPAGAVSPPYSLGAASAKGQIPVQSISVGSAERIH